MFALEYFNSDVFIWNFCLNVFEAFILLKFFLQVTVNIGKIKSCQSIFTPSPPPPAPIPLQIKYCIYKYFHNGPRPVHLNISKKNPKIL